MTKTDNAKYGVQPEVLKQIKITQRDMELAKWGGSYEKNLVQGIVSTPPEEWNEGQLEKAKKLKLNEMTAEQVRHWFDNETGG